jgi:type II secretory pathway pseudopilin PulG
MKSKALIYTPKMHLPAFTLMEILVVLVISSTVISLALWSYVNVSRYLNSYQEHEAANQEMALFITHFQHDVDRAHVISDKKGYLHLMDFNGEEISYDFFEDYTIRYFYNYPDTFFVKIKQARFVPLAANPAWINEITLSLQVSGVEYPMTFYKFYSNQQLFQAYAN